MRHVEDLLDVLVRFQHAPGFAAIQNAWHAQFLSNVHGYVARGQPLSTRQAKVVLSAAGKVRSALVASGIDANTLDRLLSHPTYRTPPVESTVIPREVRYLGDNKLGFRFRLNETIRTAIQSLKDIDPIYCATEMRFDYDTKIWVVPVTRLVLPAIIEIIADFDFSFDDAVVEYLALAKDSIDQPSHVFLDGERIVLNVCANELLAFWTTNVARGEPL